MDPSQTWNSCFVWPSCTQHEFMLSFKSCPVWNRASQMSIPAHCITLTQKVLNLRCPISALGLLSLCWLSVLCQISHFQREAWNVAGWSLGPSRPLSITLPSHPLQVEPAWCRALGFLCGQVKGSERLEGRCQGALCSDSLTNCVYWSFWVQLRAGCDFCMGQRGENGWEEDSSPTQVFQDGPKCSST